MFDLPESKTEIAQFAIRSAVSGLTASAVATVVADNTEKDADDLIVEIPSACVGYYVGMKLKPVTDAVIAKIATKLSRSKTPSVETVTA